MLLKDAERDTYITDQHTAIISNVKMHTFCYTNGQFGVVIKISGL